MRALNFLTLGCGIALIVLLAFTGSGEVIDPLNIQDDAARPAGSLSSATTIGQTFIARAPRLSAIQVRWIVSDDFAFAPNSRVTLHLRERVSDSSDLAAASIPLAEIHHNQFTPFRFAPLADSQDKAYYFFLDASQAEITRGWLSVWASDDDALPDGQMFFAGSATNADLAFRAFSSPDFFFALDAFGKALARESSGIPIAVLIFFIPGLALALSFRAKREISFALIGGLSLATLSAASLILLWLRLPVAWLIVALVVLVFVEFLLTTRAASPSVIASRTEQFPTHESGLTASQPFDTATKTVAPLRVLLALTILALLSFAVGLIQFAELPTPLWIDSYVHATYIKEFLHQEQLALDQIYHYGFHSIGALLVQLSGLALPQAMILIGQLIVTQIGLSFFAFGKRLTGSAVVGLVSAMCVWFFAPTPLYFITWGRYPLLLGTAILPIALVAAMDLIEPPRFDGRAFFLAVITLAGLAFAHLRLLAFYVVFVAIYLAWHNWRARRVGASGGRVALLALAGALISIVWLAALASQHDVAQDIGARVAVVSAIDLSTALAILQSHYGSIVWALAAMGIVVAFARRSHSALIMIAWFIVLLAIAGLLLLIGAPLLDVSFVFLMGFFSAALLIGELARVLFAKTATVGLAVGLVASLFGAREMLAIVNPTTILFTHADERAMVWIQSHTSNDARFLVNSFAWYPTYYVPCDGGSWIPHTTNRAIVFASPMPPDALASWIDAQKITYVYLGHRAGVLRARDFADAPERYESVYDAEGVRIFRVNHPTRVSRLFGE